MSIRQYINKLLQKLAIIKSYDTMNVFGCPECPPEDCPTFVERAVHNRFKNALLNNNIIVVYGESRQGKTWTIEKYCPNRLRIGCTALKTAAQLKRDMLDVLGIKIRNVQHSITDEVKKGMVSSSQIGVEMAAKAGMEASHIAAHSETLTTEYKTVDLENDTEFLSVVKESAKGKYFVFDNFHYLSPAVQKEFCSLLKEFNYHGIKIIIVGVWKDASRITAMAPDLVNRCEHIDIGSWKDVELDTIIEKGEKALNITIGKNVRRQFKQCCANNIGIFKTFLLKLMQEAKIENTLMNTQMVDDPTVLKNTMDLCIEEVYAPLQDRIKNLALPQRNHKNSRHMRLVIVCSILELLQKMEIEQSQQGIPVNSIQNQVNYVCQNNGSEVFAYSNFIQELGVLHEREENRQTGGNFIPLFYYDKANRKLLVIEPTLYEIKQYDANMIGQIIASVHETEKECSVR